MTVISICFLFLYLHFKSHVRQSWRRRGCYNDTDHRHRWRRRGCDDTYHQRRGDHEPLLEMQRMLRGCLSSSSSLSSASSSFIVSIFKIIVSIFKSIVIITVIIMTVTSILFFSYIYISKVTLGTVGDAGDATMILIVSSSSLEMQGCEHDTCHQRHGDHHPLLEMQGMLR